MRAAIPSPLALAPPEDEVGRAPSRTTAKGAADARVEAIVRAHYAFLWRSLRRLGVPADAAEDAAQQVLFVLARRIDEVLVGREKSFLFGVAMRVAQADRRVRFALREVAIEDALLELPAEDKGPAEALDEHRARSALNAILEAMPLDLRSVLILHEIEEMTMAEIAEALAIPPGTVASRLRRGRELFETLVARARSKGGEP